MSSDDDVGTDTLVVLDGRADKEQLLALLLDGQSAARARGDSDSTEKSLMNMIFQGKAWCVGFVFGVLQNRSVVRSIIELANELLISSLKSQDSQP